MLSITRRIAYVDLMTGKRHFAYVRNFTLVG